MGTEQTYSGAGARVAWRPAGARAWHVAYADTRHGVADAIDRFAGRFTARESWAAAQLEGARVEWSNVTGRAWVPSDGPVALILEDDGAALIIGPATRDERERHDSAREALEAPRRVERAARRAAQRESRALELERRPVRDGAAGAARRAGATARRLESRARAAGGATAPRLDRLAYGARRVAWDADTYGYTY